MWAFKKFLFKYEKWNKVVSRHCHPWIKQGSKWTDFVLLKRGQVSEASAVQPYANYPQVPQGTYYTATVHRGVSIYRKKKRHLQNWQNIESILFLV